MLFRSVDVPLSSKDAAVACGKVLKLDTTAFQKLHLIERLSGVVNTSGFTEEEFKVLSAEELRDEAFKGYSFAYVTWEKSTEVSHASLDKLVVDAVHSDALLKSLSPEDRAEADAFMVKLKRMMLKAFDLGRHDAKISPCPF